MTVGEIVSTLRRETVTSEEFLGIEVILAYCLKIKRQDIFTHPEKEISDLEYRKFWHLFDRLRQGEPVAYLTKKKEFYGLEFYVDPAVLIPRPETEMLVEETIKLCSGKPSTIIDIGTGSGCIAISLAKKLPNASLAAVDISTAALTVAKKNAKFHKVTSQVEFFQSNLLEQVKQPYDIIVANLPYIGEEKYCFVSHEAKKYEPHIALFGGKDGLYLYGRLFQQIKQLSWKPRYLLGEFGFLQSESLQQLLNKYFIQQKYVILKDFASIERVFVVTFDS